MSVNRDMNAMKTHSTIDIARRNGYRLTIHPHKRRLDCILDATVRNIPEDAKLLQIWQEVESYLSGEFTLLLDAGIEKVQHPAMVPFLLSLQKMALARGARKIADVLSGSPIVYVLHQQIAEFAGTEGRRKVFARREDAEAWLDTLS